VLLFSCAAGAQENILLLIMDDVGSELIGVYGEGADPAHTPRLDALARGGVLFRNAYANPVCSPTRATILTGQYGFRNGVGNVNERSNRLARADLLALPRALPPAYRSAAIGKWHLSGSRFGPADVHDDLDHPIAFGGFEYFSGKGGNFNPQEPGSEGHYDIVLTLHPFRRLRFPETYYQWVKGTIWEGKRYRKSVVECSAAARHRCYVTSVTVNDAIQAMYRFNPGPWFLWVGFNAIHIPLTEPPPIHLVSNPDLANPSKYPRLSHSGKRKAHLEALDAEIGRLLDAAPANTAVILVSDNGTFLGPGRCKGGVSDCGIRVPLIIKRPGMPSGYRESRALVNTTDLFDTIVEIAGGVTDAVDSESVVPYLDDPDAVTRVRGSAGGPYIYSESFDRNEAAPDPQRALRGDARALNALDPLAFDWDQDYKLVERFGVEELYALGEDPGEQNDLMLAPGGLTPAAAAALEDLRGVMDLLQDADGDAVDYRLDNCVEAKQEPDQHCDTDQDGIGNLCDCDLDNDGLCDASDLELFNASFGLAGSGVADLDCDGFVGDADLDRIRAMLGSEPGPSGLWCADALGPPDPCTTASQ
jgi:arylsulfatase A-like enzyme